MALSKKINDSRRAYEFPFQAPMITALHEELREIRYTGDVIAVREEALELFETGTELKLAQGRSYKNLFATSLYMACIRVGVPIRFEEFVNALPTGISLMKSLLNSFSQEGYKLLPDYMAFLERYCRQLRIMEWLFDVKSTYLATKVLHIGKNPHAHIGGCIYWISTLHNGGPTQKRIAELTGVTPVAVRVSFQRIRELYATRKKK